MACAPVNASMSRDEARVGVPQDFAAAERPNGQNVRSEEDTGENTKTSVPPMRPM
jgi:hypothetical protein